MPFIPEGVGRGVLGYPQLSHNLLRVFVHIVVSYLIGQVYVNAGGRASGTIGNFIYVFSSILTVVGTGNFSGLLSTLNEKEVLKKEYFNKWYSYLPYVAAFLIVEIIFQTVLCILYIPIGYWLTGNPMETFRIGIFTMGIVLSSLSGQAWGHLIGATTPQKIAVMLGPISLCAFSVFGFNLYLPDTPYMLLWLYYISYYRAGYHTGVIAIYGFNRGKIPCDDEYCYFSKPMTTFLNKTGVYDEDLYVNIAVFLSTIVVIHICTFSFLWIRLTKR